MNLLLDIIDEGCSVMMIYEINSSKDVVMNNGIVTKSDCETLKVFIMVRMLVEEQERCWFQTCHRISVSGTVTASRNRNLMLYSHYDSIRKKCQV
jgi:aspartate-semialdehyde dehydrogenase